MSYGIEQYGIGSWGGSDFIVTNQIPSDLAVNVNRLPNISFTLSSQSGNVTLASINLTVNSIALIINGVFTTAASGTINNSNPAQVQVTAQVLHAFAPLQSVTVVVTALNAVNQSPTLGATWQFSVNNTIYTFQSHIVRNFERTLRIGATGLTAPQNPNTQIITTGLKIFWDSVQNAVSYNVYWLTLSGVTISNGNPIFNITDIYYNHINLSSATTYYYIVVAVDKNGNLSTPSIEFIGTTS